MNLTPYHARYFAHDLTRRASSGLDRLSMSLFDAAVDMNPHQIEAALFALELPHSKGVLLADEVGLGKTIEAGIVLCQFWAERKRRLIVICPASLRKQWALELSEKFNLPTRVLDAKTFKDEQRLGRVALNEKAVLIVSFSSCWGPDRSLREPPDLFPARVVDRQLLGARDEPSGVGHSIENSAIVSIGTVSLTVLVSLLAGYGLSRLRFPGSAIVFTLILAAAMVPFQVIVTPVFIVLQLIGLDEQPHRSHPRDHHLPTAFRRLHHAQRLRRDPGRDLGGCRDGRRGAAARPVVDAAAARSGNPYRRPVRLLLGVERFLRRPHPAQRSVAVYASCCPHEFINGARGSVNWGLLQSGIVVSIAPCAVIFLLLQRHYVSGLMSGAGK